MMINPVWTISPLMEEVAFQDMKKILFGNGLQITLKTLIDSLEELLEQRGSSTEAIMVLEGLKGLYTGYMRRYEEDEPDHTSDIALARFESRCSRCDGLINIGDRIEKTIGGWMHEDCPADPPDPDPFDLDPDVGDH